MWKRQKALWKQQSNKPGLAATPSIQRCGSAGGTQGAAASPTANTATSVKERDRSIRGVIKMAGKNIQRNTHAHTLHLI